MQQGSDNPLHVVLRCDSSLLARVRYVFDTLFTAAGIDASYGPQPPRSGPWVLYAATAEIADTAHRCLAIVHSPEAWQRSHDGSAVEEVRTIDGLAVPFPQDATSEGSANRIPFDIIANSFYFLASLPERLGKDRARNRQLYATSVFARLGVPQDIVDRYLARIRQALDAIESRSASPAAWADGRTYAVVLSHDVDFVSEGAGDTLKQGVKTVLRHLVRQRDLADAVKSGAGFLRAVVAGRDPYSGVHEILAREKALAVRSSFQVAVGHRHPNDVNYRIENDATRDYLRAILDDGFDLCLHGSYRSSEDPDWYAEEAQLLGRRLAQPRGSRQHFLSFEYDNLFRAQERSGIEYDMSMGYPDRVGPRAGFSFPYFPYCLDEDRPYDVLQISLVLMDVTLRGYMALKGEEAWRAVRAQLDDLRSKGGCASVVWHPIVFGRARDPGYDDLFWRLVQYVRDTGGLATDGRTINTAWRERASSRVTFANRQQV